MSPTKKREPGPQVHICILCGEAVSSMVDHIKRKHEEFYKPREKKGAK